MIDIEKEYRKYVWAERRNFLWGHLGSIAMVSATLFYMFMRISNLAFCDRANVRADPVKKEILPKGYQPR